MIGGCQRNIRNNEMFIAAYAICWDQPDAGHTKTILQENKGKNLEEDT